MIKVIKLYYGKKNNDQVKSKDTSKREIVSRAGFNATITFSATI